MDTKRAENRFSLTAINMAAEITADKLPGYDQVAAIEAWLRSSIQYIPRSSNVPVSAVDVNLRQSGVGHVAIGYGRDAGDVAVLSVKSGIAPVHAVTITTQCGIMYKL